MKYRWVFIGWLLCHTLNLIGWQIQSVTYQWCVKYNDMLPAKVDWCARECYTSVYYTGVALQYNPVSHLFYFTRSIIDGE